MADNPQPEKDITPPETNPADEPTTPTEPNPAPAEPKPEGGGGDLKKLLDDLKSDFTAKLQAQAAQYEKQLKERDEYIKTLLTSDNTAPKKSVAEELNLKRDFKKW